MTIYAGFDPGKTVGLAVADESGVVGYTTVNWKKLDDYLLHDWDRYWGEKPATAVVEDYRLNAPDSNRVEPIQSKIETVQGIGAIRHWCTANEIEFIEQARMYKPVGYKYWGKKPLPKSNPTNNAYDAAAHLMYWLVQNKKVRIKL